MIKFKYVILYVENVESSMNFYKNTFNAEIKFITPDKDYGELITGETTLSFASVEVHTSQLQPIMGIPVLVPVPRNVIVSVG